MANISNFLATALLNQVFRNTNYTRPTTVYVALYTSNPTAADTGTEVSGGSYARQAVTFAAPAAVSGKQTVKNSADITFPTATADWGNITHVGLRDAATGGNLLYYGALDNPRSILTGDIFKHLANSIAPNLY
ncbi:hypothetical protein [Cohnella sp. GbtcB17]|uniref:phage tail fiber protein n=1 Tax=Cohnella sp. GbtcB17 TaxID=2824762 RepID=UPI001C30CD3E|nr:hypothetical protein [Cohnella sp. GbtcB17]